MTLTALSSVTKSSRYSGSNVLWLRSVPATNRFMSSTTLNNWHQCSSPSTADPIFSHSLGRQAPIGHAMEPNAGHADGERLVVAGPIRPHRRLKNSSTVATRPARSERSAGVGRRPTTELQPPWPCVSCTLGADLRPSLARTFFGAVAFLLGTRSGVSRTHWPAAELATSKALGRTHCRVPRQRKADLPEPLFVAASASNAARLRANRSWLDALHLGQGTAMRRRDSRFV